MDSKTALGDTLTIAPATEITAFGDKLTILHWLTLSHADNSIKHKAYSTKDASTFIIFYQSSIPLLPHQNLSPGQGSAHWQLARDIPSDSWPGLNQLKFSQKHAQ